MGDSDDTVRLEPSFLRASVSVIALYIFVSILGFFLQGYFEGHWWSRAYVIELPIPLAIIVVVVWFAFVPKTLEFSAKEFKIQFPFRRSYTFSWDELDLYGRGENVFGIQFVGHEPFQILSYAYPRRQWRQFANFLLIRFPDNKASGWIGASMFKWGRRKGP